MCLLYQGLIGGGEVSLYASRHAECLKANGQMALFLTEHASGHMRPQDLPVTVPWPVYLSLPMVYAAFQALRALGCLVAHHSANRDELASKRLPAPRAPGAEADGDAEAPLGPPALPLLLRFALKGGTPQERSAADFAIKCFCEVRTGPPVACHQLLFLRPHQLSHQRMSR